jgi:hypothetical protein
MNIVGSGWKMGTRSQWLRAHQIILKEESMKVTAIGCPNKKQLTESM